MLQRNTSKRKPFGSKEIQDFIDDLDLHVSNDITTDCNCEEPYCEHTYSIYALSTLNDPSVGIFGVIVTPWFKSEAELIAYIEANKDKIEKEGMGDE